MSDPSKISCGDAQREEEQKGVINEAGRGIMKFMNVMAAIDSKVHHKHIHYIL